ncbi:MAG TPA: CapA family protein [Bacteroidales bacterium]|nr:CapA family protein [Bacteroidales bacterium]
MKHKYQISCLCLSCLLLFPLFSNVKGQESDSAIKHLTLLFTGDIMGHDSQIASAFDPETGKYNYDSVFKYIRPVLSDADITIANLEVTLAGPPYKGYPQFSSPADLAVACVNAGVDYFVVANNHAADRGGKGILSTINKLDSIGIPHTGSYRNKAERDSLSPLMIHRNGISLALLNYTYGTNGIRVPEPFIIDSLDRNIIATDIMKAKEKKADAIVLFVHWGTEYDTIPGKAQSSLAAFCLENGADLVIGSHPHVIQKMAWVKKSNGKDGIVVYSLGNFISNQRKPKTDGGTIVKIELTKKNDTISVANAGYYLTWVYTPVENSKTRFYILPCSVFGNKQEFFNKSADFSMMSVFIYESRKLLNSQNEGINEYIFRENAWQLDNSGKMSNFIPDCRIK